VSVLEVSEMLVTEDVSVLELVSVVLVRLELDVSVVVVSVVEVVEDAVVVETGL